MQTPGKLGIRTALVAFVAGSLIIPMGQASATPEVAQRAPSATVPEASVTTTSPTASRATAQTSAQVTVGGGPRLQVLVGPAHKGPGAWQFTLQRQSGGSWKPAGTYRTVGSREELSLPVAAGTYRVVVPAQHGLASTTSKPTKYVPTPEITVAGHGALEVKVGPIRTWQVTLERHTEQGWSAVKSAKARGLKRVVFNVDAGTYRVRTAANGRFPAFTGKPFEFAPQAPSGPIPYGFLDAAFSSADSASAKSATTRSSSSNCASVMSSSGAGLTVATGLINFIPYVGRGLSSAIKGQAANAQANAEEACLSAQVSTINSQLSFQESQISQLQTSLASAEAEISQEFADAAAANVKEQQAPFYNSVADLAQCTGGGLFYDFMTDFGLWNGCYAPTSATIQSVATSSTFASQSTFGENNQTPFNSSLENVAGNYLLPGSCSGSLLPSAPGKKAPDCQNHIGPYPDSQLSELQGALTLALSATLNVSQDPGAQNTNLVPVFDAYNQSLVSYYQQSVVGIQAAFTMESLVNQLNYYNAGKNAPIDSLGQVPGTYYSFQALQSALGSKPSAAAQAQYFNLAQRALAQMYAARMNQLYQDTIGFIVTDDPLGSQAWPAGSGGTGNNINANVGYAENVGALVTTDAGVGGLKSSTPLALLPAAATQGSTWTANAALYQYFGLRDAGACYANLLQWNQANGTAVQAKNGTWYPTASPSQNELAGGAFNTLCPPILTSATGGAVSAPPTSSTLNTCATYASPANAAGGSCYDGNSLVPYYANASLPEVGSAVLTNLVLCNAADPALTWFQVGPANAGNAAGLTLGDWALTCGNWAAPVGPGYPNDAFPRSSPPISWGTTSLYACPSGSTAPYCANAYNGFWGPFYNNSFTCTSRTDCTSNVSQYTYNSFWVPGYYGPQTSGSLPYVPPSTAQPVNIGGSDQSSTLTVDTSNCYSGNWLTNASLDTSSGCTLTFNPVRFSNNEGSAGLATMAVSLPNSITGAPSGGFALPITVGATQGSQPAGGQNEGMLIGVWVSSNTSIANVGYFAPASSVSEYFSGDNFTWYTWSQSGYITVADGSCWNINVGRNADNQGTISFNQITPASACAS